ncbi:3-hydroxybutyrate dehydrogenase [Roseicella aquatilis]|uniref:3-hydroxybutyrate dehydrogenase n=1 Tax=Roseicella aquatilis TaxID=2527868 RepID=A0A4R4DSY4_9PROT|nr:3-hydroxybutyrate dehydrogenase [Roseicella aquatilis]TCZ63876.1 3-hydroxybutyrate dehydrogenase [Roseicella aquatilis]
MPDTLEVLRNADGLPTEDLRTSRDPAAPPLYGRVALVTGSTRGIGFGIAEALAAAGCRVVLNGRGEEGRQAEDRFARGQARYVAADLREPRAAHALLAACQVEFGAVDILVNNAGIQHVAPVEAFPDDRWEEIIALNLTAAFRAARSALPGMRRRGFGRIINIASVHGLVASEGKSAYVAAKHGLVGLTKAIALETANDGITCNAICPGWVRTDLVEAQVERIAATGGLTMEDAAAELLRAKQPMRRFSTPEGIGSLVVFLCGEAAATVTGAALTMDGGWVSV